MTTTKRSETQPWASYNETQPVLCPNCGSEAIGPIRKEVIEVWQCLDCGTYWSDRT